MNAIGLLPALMNSRMSFGPVVDRLAANGTDLAKRPVEVAPIAHFHMGGVRVDETLQARVPGLYACGEAVGGANGTNRLSGNAINRPCAVAEESLEAGNRILPPDLFAAITFFAVMSSSYPRIGKAAQPRSKTDRREDERIFFVVLSEAGSAKRPWGSETTGRRS